MVEADFSKNSFSSDFNPNCSLGSPTNVRRKEKKE
jgi:hypothetical protein